MPFGHNALLIHETLAHGRRQVTDWHAHCSGQLYWLKRGMLAVETKSEQWALTSGAVGWLPPGCQHKGTAFGLMEGSILYLGSTLCHGLPDAPSLGIIDDFLSALLSRLTRFGGVPLNQKQRRLLGVLADELHNAPPAPVRLILPDDRRALAAACWIMDYPDEDFTQDIFARRAGLSVRTLRRLFLKETGLGFSQWRQQARLLRSLEFLSQGYSVSNMAAACGYSNTSSYIALFRQRFGVTPGAYFDVKNSS